MKLSTAITTVLLLAIAGLGVGAALYEGPKPITLPPSSATARPKSAGDAGGAMSPQAVALKADVEALAALDYDLKAPGQKGLGRVAGTPGAANAALYIRRRFREIGL